MYDAVREALLEKNTESDTTYLQDCFKAAQQLEFALNSFLKRQILFTWVNTEGKILFYDQVETEKLYSSLQVSGTANAKGKFKVPNEDNAINNFTDPILQKMKIKVEMATKNRAVVYKEALIRYDQKSKKKDKENGMEYKNDSTLQNTFWWRTNIQPYINWGQNNGNTKYNKGDIAQAYADAIINNRENFNNMRDIEISLSYLNKFINTNSVAAILRGDIILKDNGKIQFQIKSFKSSSAALGQYIVLAYFILSKENITANEIKKYFQKSLQKNHNSAQLILQDLFDYSQKELEKQWSNINHKILMEINI